MCNTGSASSAGVPWRLNYTAEHACLALTIDGRRMDSAQGCNSPHVSARLQTEQHSSAKRCFCIKILAMSGYCTHIESSDEPHMYGHMLLPVCLAGVKMCLEVSTCACCGHFLDLRPQEVFTGTADLKMSHMSVSSAVANCSALPLDLGA